MKLNRRELLWGSLALGAGGSLLACGPRGPAGPGGPGHAQGCSSAVAEAISDNHGHDVAVPTADIDAAVEKTYDLQADADHAHSVTLTPEHFAELAAGRSVVLTSSTGSEHSHTVRIGCSEPIEDPGGGDYYP